MSSQNPRCPDDRLAFSFRMAEARVDLIEPMDVRLERSLLGASTAILPHSFKICAELGVAGARGEILRLVLR